MKSLIASITILGLVGMAVGVGTQAANEASVAATVTVQNISLTVSDGTVTYGTLAVNTSKDTTAVPQLNDTQTATNDGNVTENFNIRGTDSANWTLGVTAGTNVYVHQFCTTGGGTPDPCDATPTYTALTTSNQTLATDVVATTGTKRFDLKITTPTATTFFTPQSVNVTVQAILTP